MIDEITSQSLARNTSKGSCNKKSQLTDLYEDKSIASEKTTKPLTNVTNSCVPQTDVHLYQFPASFYSCEVRLVLEEKGINYEEHDICIIGGVFDQYEPDYVRINPCCVVPALVVDGRVTSDAHNIVLHADEFFPQTVKLFPNNETRNLVQEQFDLACSVFVEALSFGEVEGGPKLPWIMPVIARNNHAKKSKALKGKLKEHEDDPYLKACYEDKLKILTKQIEILKDEKELCDIVDATKDIIRKLNEQLTNGHSKDGTSWLCGKDYTIADMQWGLVLIRLQFRGYRDLLWSQYPTIESYYQRLMSRPAIQKAVVANHNGPKIGRLILWRKLSIAKNGKTIFLAAFVAALVGVGARAFYF